MEAVTINNQYPFRVWGISLVLGPAFFILYGFLTSAIIEFDIMAILGGTILAAVFGIVFSIPAFIFYYFCFRILLKRIKSKVHLRWILTSIAIVCMMVTFYFVLGQEFSFKGEADLFLPYSVGIILAGQLVRVSRP